VKYINLNKVNKMATTITGKLNKPAKEFQAGAYTGFGIRLGVKYYDRETKQNEYTNYEAAIFTNNTQQIEFYRSALVEGAIVELTAKNEQIKSFAGQNGQVLYIKLLDASLGYVYKPESQPQQAAPQQFQAQPQQFQAAPQPVQQANGMPDFPAEDIPF